MGCMTLITTGVRDFEQLTTFERVAGRRCTGEWVVGVCVLESRREVCVLESR
jgi:hypothetical protein